MELWSEQECLFDLSSHNNRVEREKKWTEIANFMTKMLITYWNTLNKSGSPPVLRMYLKKMEKVDGEGLVWHLNRCSHVISVEDVKT